MGSSLIFDAVVGMVFVFAIFTFAVSGVVEGLARIAGLRAEFLLRGISSMLDSDTKFEKGWVSRLAQKAIDEQGKGAQDAVLDAEAKIGELPADAPAHDEITTALEKAKAIVPPHRPVTDATNKVKTAEKALKKLLKNTDATQKAATMKAVENAQKEQEAAEKALEEWLAQNPTPAAITDARTAIDAVPPLLAHAQAEIDKPPTGFDLEAAVTKLAASRRFFLPAQQALEVAQGNRQAVSAASLISEPIVDLTAALNRLFAEEGVVGV